MKISEQWLREWINPNVDTRALCHALTMAGLEIEGEYPVAADFSNVLVAEVVSIEPHPDAKKLKVCQVNVGKETLTIVCGASNVAEGARVPAALIGAVLPGGLEIKEAELRGVKSNGMLCSTKELGLPADVDGLWILPSDAPIGMSIRDYAKFNDTILEINLTPNRGDCLSVLGLARELSAIYEMPYSESAHKENHVTIQDTLPIHIKSPEACPRYVGRVIKKIDATKTTPLWMQETLRRSDIRTISPVVDVLNYVMLELGQPMHAFDATKITDHIDVRFAKEGESLVLLNQETRILQSNTLIIADKKGPLAIAGVMGGLKSSVTSSTTDIFLESAFFTPFYLSGQARRYGLQTDSAYRFERGVDFNLQVKALERATNLLLEIVDGEVGPLIEKMSDAHLPVISPIELHLNLLNQKIGVPIGSNRLEQIFKHLGMLIEKKSEEVWMIMPPTYRFDLNISEDLIEEVARIYGYDHILAKSVCIQQSHHLASAKIKPDLLVKQIMQDLAYHEAITYSFIAEQEQKAIDPHESAMNLVNPISADMTVMRTSLWAGLIKAMQFNQHRQQARVRLFEIGQRFLFRDENLLQESVLSGLITGSRMPEQWGEKAQAVDFFDMVGDLERLFEILGHSFACKPAEHSALHPGQTAEILLNGEPIGLIGLIHPALMQKMNIKSAVFLFELKLSPLLFCPEPQFKEISKFPAIRRDFAFIVDKHVNAADMIAQAKVVMNEWLVDWTLFDVFSGQSIGENKKSIALGLTLQHPSRTLKDEEVVTLGDEFIKVLHSKYGAVLRD